ncbi:MAG: hypothetical protein ACP5DX_13950 [Paracoccaceae bacterium]
MHLETDLLGEGMLPQTAASYVTLPASTLKWAYDRGGDVPYSVVFRAMNILRDT